MGLLALAGAAQAQDCHLHQYDSLPFTRSEQGLMLPVVIGDAHEDLALNLGNAGSALTAETAKKLDLRLTHMTDKFRVHRGDGIVQYVAHAPAMTLGASTIPNMEFLVLPPSEDGKRAGDIGTQLFANADIELDMAAGKMNLFDSDHCPGIAVYWTTQDYTKLPVQIDGVGYIRAQMLLDGKPVVLALSTEGRSSLSMAAMQRLFGLDASSPGMTLVNTGEDGSKYYRYAFQKLEAGGLTISHPAITVRDNPRAHECKSGEKLKPGLVRTGSPVLRIECYGGADGNLGLPILAKLHLYLSRKEKLLYLTSAGAH